MPISINDILKETDMDLSREQMISLYQSYVCRETSNFLLKNIKTLELKRIIALSYFDQKVTRQKVDHNIVRNDLSAALRVSKKTLYKWIPV